MTSLTLVRRIAARPAIVFEALTTAEGVAAWWGPDDLPVILAEIDPRVGGAYRVRFQTLDGLQHEAFGEYLEVSPPDRVVMTWRYAFGGEPEELGLTSRIEAVLRPIGEDTELTFTHSQLRNEASRASHEWGWTGSLDKLVRSVRRKTRSLKMPTFNRPRRRRPGAHARRGPIERWRKTRAAYASMAPIEQYRMSQADEIALAKSAAPAAISSQAEVLTLGAHGYDAAVQGKNGFVCIVERAWADGLTDPEFWNPKPRSPICFNPAAVRSVLPTYLQRTQWVLAGASKADIVARTKAALAAHQIPAPEIGAMCYMMSKDGYLNDTDRHWHPHLMFFLPRMATAEWGANVPGGAVIGDGGSDLEPITTFFVPLAKWSDGTPAQMGQTGM